MNPPAPIHRPSLRDSQSSLAGRFAFSLLIGFLILSAGATVLARFIIPSLIPPKTIVRVLSSPAAESVELPQEITSSLQFTSPPPAPSRANPPLDLPPLPPPDLWESPPSPDTTQLLSMSETALQAIASFEDAESSRLELLDLERNALEKERLEKERREEEARRLAAQQQQKKRAQQEAEADRRRVASLATKVSSPPSLSHRTTPRYPTAARKTGLEGTTRIAATITASGTVDSPRVLVSSGHRSLDSSALAAVKKWRFNPAKNALGQPIAFQMTIPVTFRLR